MTAVTDDARLAAVRSYGLLDAPRPTVLDDLARLACSVLDTPMSTVTLVDRDRLWFAGSAGMPADGGGPAKSFCGEVVASGRPLVVSDVPAHPGYRTWARVPGGPDIRFYAGVPLVDEDGHLLGTVCVLDHRPREIDARQLEMLTRMAGQAAGHLRAARDRLRLAEVGDRLARALSREEDFVSTVSHELRTPITTIQGYLELLLDNEELAPYRKLIAPIQRNGDRLVRMVDHLLAGTRAPGAPLPLLRAEADLVEVAQGAVAACRPQAAQRDVPILIEASGGELPVPGDVARLTEAAEQLVRNAVLFSPAGSAVTVRVEAGCLEVSDAGSGIPAGELPHVTARFYRGEHAREQAVPGVGLGLSIVERVMRAHHGELTMASRGPGEGTVARMVMPGEGSHSMP